MTSETVARDVYGPIGIRNGTTETPTALRAGED